MGKKFPDNDRPTPWILKNPYGPVVPEDRERHIPGKLKNPFDGKAPPRREKDISEVN